MSSSSSSSNASQEEEEPTSYFDVYGPQAVAELVFKTADKQSSLTFEDIQSLVRWVLADGTMPSWVFIKNKPLISKFMMLYVPGLNASMYMSHTKLFGNLTQCCGKPRALLAPSPRMDPAKMLELFFTVKYKKNPEKGASPLLHQASGVKQTDSYIQATFEERSPHKSRKLDQNDSPRGSRLKTVEIARGGSLEKDPQAQFPASYYTLTEAEMQEHNYPLSAYDDDYVQTQPGASDHDIVAIDCEMCYTKNGLELTRVSLVDKEGKVLFDSLVKPLTPILDYNTRYSGITHAMMENVTSTLKDVQRAILKFVSAETIIVGHSLENDLSALKIVHKKIIDTTILYRHPRGTLFKPALRILASHFLQRKIQGGDVGHDSIEDARAAMDLALLKFQKGPDFGRRSSIYKVNLFSVLSEHGNQCSVVDRMAMLQRYAHGPCHAIPCVTDMEVLSKAKKEVGRKCRNFIWAQFSDLHFFQEKQAECLQANLAKMAALMTCNAAPEDGFMKREMTPEYEKVLVQLDGRIKELHEALPSGTMFVVASGHGDIASVRRLRHIVKDKLLDREEVTQRPWASILGDIQAEAETAVAFVCIKQ